MGYPMTYRRVVDRNLLRGEYTYAAPEPLPADEAARSLIRGDLRRLETDSRDPIYLKLYARHAGVTEAQAKAVLDAFFDGVRRIQDLMPDEEYLALRQQMDADAARKSGA